MPRVKANITPNVMAWARESCGYSLDDAASKIGRSVEEVSAWESGELQPTIPQARIASKVYKRPLAVFFLPEPPAVFSTLRDFRRLPSDIPNPREPVTPRVRIPPGVEYGFDRVQHPFIRLII